MIPQCVSGDTYRIAICTANALGEYVLPDNAPHVDQLCAPRTTIPNTPSNLSIVFNKSRCTVSWSAVTNADIAYYEVRTDLHAGTKDDALLLRTNSLQADVKLTERTGNVYVYACGTDGKYSAAASVTYSKAAPKAPSPPTVADKLGGMSIVAVALPDDCVGMNIYINDLCVYSVNNVVTYTCAAGIYDVSVAYVDYFGEGEHSATSRCTVKEKVDTSLLADQAVTRQKVDQVIDKAVQDTQTTLPQQIQVAAASVTSVVTNLNDATKAKTYSAIAQMSDAIATKITRGDMTSYLQQDHTGFYIKGSLINIDGTTKIGNNIITKDMIQSKAVTAEKMDVNSLSAITSTIGTFQTATSGRRVVIKDSVVQVYNDKGVLVMRYGVW